MDRYSMMNRYMARRRQAPPPTSATGGMGTLGMRDMAMGNAPAAPMGNAPVAPAPAQGIARPMMQKMNNAMKKGGKVKKASGASKRADGIARKGKTKGKFV